MTDGPKARARDLGVAIGLLPTGPLNAITDVAGVRVGHATLIDGEGDLRPGSGPVRTGVTVVVGHDGGPATALYAGSHTLNGNGEMTGLEWLREAGVLTTPIALTNTHSVGVVRDALIAAEAADRAGAELAWALPVVAETWDGMLSDINGQHVRPEHLLAALADARTGPVAEGNVGGGTGMVCHEFKGGIGSSSRVVEHEAVRFTVGVLVQANQGRRERLTIAGVDVGRRLPLSAIPSPYRSPASAPGGSIIAIVATDAPLLPHHCRALAERAGLGVARTGGAGERTSGDIFLCFSTANRLALDSAGVSFVAEGVAIGRPAVLSDRSMTAQ